MQRGKRSRPRQNPSPPATNDLDSLDPHQWQSSAANDVGFAIFEALYEWDYLASVPDSSNPTTQ